MKKIIFLFNLYITIFFINGCFVSFKKLKKLNLSYVLYATVYRAIWVPTRRNFFVALYEFAFYEDVLYGSPLYKQIISTLGIFPKNISIERLRCQKITTCFFFRNTVYYIGRLLSLYYLLLHHFFRLKKYSRYFSKIEDRNTTESEKAWNVETVHGVRTKTSSFC